MAARARDVVRQDFTIEKELAMLRGILGRYWTQLGDDRAASQDTDLALVTR